MDHDVSFSWDFAKQLIEQRNESFLGEYSDPRVLPGLDAYFLDRTESQEAKKASSNDGYRSKVRVLDRYKVVGFISSGTYGRVYKAVGVNGQSGEFAIKKYSTYNHTFLAGSGNH